MTDAPFMQLYVGDYLADTLDLTTEQHGAYLLLLMTMWRHGAKLPNDPKKLARIARVSPRRWPQVWAEIERFFYVEGDDIRNNRLDREHQKATSISQKRSAAGAKGGAAKALKTQEAPLANAVAGLKHSQKSDIREEAKASSPRKRGSRLPEDWLLPRDWGEWAMGEGLSEIAVRREADKFRDYWCAKSGKDATKADWGATWRNWVRNAIERNPSQQKGNGNGRVSAAQRAAERFAREQGERSSLDFRPGDDAPIPLFPARYG